MAGRSRGVSILHSVYWYACEGMESKRETQIMHQKPEGHHIAPVPVFCLIVCNDKNESFRRVRDENLAVRIDSERSG